MFCTLCGPNVTKTAFVYGLGGVKGVERVGDENRMVHPVPKELRVSSCKFDLSRSTTVTSRASKPAWGN